MSYLSDWKNAEESEARARAANPLCDQSASCPAPDDGHLVGCKRGPRRDWRIVLEPRIDPDWPGGGTLEVLAGDQQDAVDALEGWAETIERLGFVPEGLDWLNRSPAAIGRRVGRLRYTARVDTFERETENGTSSGAGWLVARPA